MNHLLKELIKKLNNNSGLAGVLLAIAIACFPNFFLENRLLVGAIILGYIGGTAVTVATLQNTNNNQNGPNNTP